LLSTFALLAQLAGGAGHASDRLAGALADLAHRLPEPSDRRVEVADRLPGALADLTQRLTRHSAHVSGDRPFVTEDRVL
jgi:hypothetical protein